MSKISVGTVATLEMTQEREMSEEELKSLAAVTEEFDIQWEIYRLLVECAKKEILN